MKLCLLFIFFGFSQIIKPKNFELVNSIVESKQNDENPFDIKVQNAVLSLHADEKNSTEIHLTYTTKYLYFLIIPISEYWSLGSRLYRIEIKTGTHRFLLKTINDLSNLDIFVDNEIIVLQETNPISIWFTTDINKDFQRIDINESIQQVYFDGVGEEIMLHTNMNFIYKVASLKVSNVSTGFNIKWHPTTQSWWFTDVQHYPYKIMYMSKGSNKIRTFCGASVSYGLTYELVWSVCKINRRNHIIFMTKKKKIVFGKFLSFLKIQYVLRLFYQHGTIIIFLAEYNGNHETYTLWRGSVKDYEFNEVEIDFAEGAKPHVDDARIVLINELKGLMFLTIEIRKTFSTAISFNYGSTYTWLRLAESINDKLCERPYCKIALHKLLKKVPNLSIKYKPEYPLLLISKGSISWNDQKIFTGILISEDCGTSWFRAPKDIYDIEIIGEAEILVGIFRALTLLKYSTDHGHSWNKLSNDDAKFNIHGFLPQSQKYSLKAAFTYKHKNFHATSLVIFDFTSLFRYECSASDMEIFLLGPNQESQCFKGSKWYAYKKNTTSLCLRNIYKRTHVKSESCRCTIDDFQCMMDYYMSIGKCFPYSYEKLNQIKTSCYGGEIIPKTKTTKSSEQVCKNEIAFQDDQVELCDRIYEQISFYISISHRIKVNSPHPYRKFHSASLPDVLQPSYKILDFCVDTENRRIYFSSYNSITFKNYGTQRSLVNIKEQILALDIGIIGILFDPTAKNLYYYTQHKIRLVETVTRIKKTIYISKFPIYGVEFSDVYRELLILCYGLKDKKIISKYNVITLSGKEIHSKSLKEFAKSITKGGNYISLYYKDETVITSLIDGEIIHSSSYFTDIHYSKLIENIALIVTRHGYFYKHHFHLLKNIKIVHILNSLDNKIKQGCRFSSCDQICISLTDVLYKCVCEDGMEYDNELRSCKCPKYLGCRRCQEDEFLCKNNICIYKYLKCNGVDDCGDKSDENCDKECRKDEFLCSIDEQCIKLSFLCDGKDDCTDRSDEQNCQNVRSLCLVNNFECFNHRCVSEDLVCDGVDDCGDYSDEFNCELPKCGKFQEKCDDGQCIDSEKLCDGVFNCHDWSDERACVMKYIVNRFPSLSCIITCGSGCVTVEQLCDHIFDCPLGEDEINCGHMGYCPPLLPFVCAENNICFGSKHKCDGFSDCKDFSDELQCQKRKMKCMPSKTFLCDNNMTTVCLEQLCDSKLDCRDGTDEIYNCIKNLNNENMVFLFLSHGNVKINWTSSASLYGPVKLMVISMNSDELVYHNSKYEHSMVTIPNHIICSKYVFSISIPSVRLFKHFHYTYVPPINMAPMNISYNADRQLITWKTFLPGCMSRIFYIICSKKDDTVVKNFTGLTQYNIPAKLANNCSISICPASIYSALCGPFGSVELKDERRVNMLLVFCVLSLVLIILMICLQSSFIKNLLKYCCFSCFYHNNTLEKLKVEYVVNELTVNEK